MLKNILPMRFNRSLDFLKVDKLSEIRLRVGQPTVLNYGGRYYLGENGLADNEQNSLKVASQELNDIIFRACECSVYAHNEELRQGYITLNNGVRIGICGEVVIENNEVKTIKNFSSVNIRIPHEIKNCSLNALPFLYDESGVYNTLVIAPPGAGKTTFIRDLTANLSDKFIAKNILVVDERNELGAVLNGKAGLYLGKFADVFSGANKQFGIINGIRTMTPEVIVLDELITAQDFEAIRYTMGCGVKVIATTHSKDLFDLAHKPFFKDLLKENAFERFVVLSNRRGAGTLEGVWDKNNTCLYCS